MAKPADVGYWERVLGRSIGIVAAIVACVGCRAAVAERAPTVANRPPASSPPARDESPTTPAITAADGDTPAEERAPAIDDEASSDEDGCPDEMARVDASDHAFCIDRWEASLVEIAEDGSERSYEHWLPVDGHAVRAVSRPDVFPQAYISEVQAEAACEASGKTLCDERDWMTACGGPAGSTFPYGDERRPGMCHDSGRSAVVAVFGTKAVFQSAAPQGGRVPAARGLRPKGPKAPARHAANSNVPAKKASPRRPGKGGARAPAGKRPRKPPKPAMSSVRPAQVDASVWTRLNDPALGRVEGALGRTGEHAACVSSYGVHDMVGNLHEWVRSDPRLPHGTFAGGYYLDTALNGDGCRYRTRAHAHDYHDYSTGFRCCAPVNDTSAVPAPPSAPGDDEGSAAVPRRGSAR